jgi:murein DD-endopeptidase MepM/ murein hydrolase activator NlpD
MGEEVVMNKRWLKLLTGLAAVAILAVLFVAPAGAHDQAALLATDTRWPTVATRPADTRWPTQSRWPSITRTPSTTSPIPTATDSATPTPPSDTQTPSETPLPTLANPTHTFPLDPPSLGDFAEGGHTYPATDIFAPAGSRFVAVTAGVVDFVSYQDLWDPAVGDMSVAGGLCVAIVGDDGVRYYGSHLQAVADGIHPGLRVQAGQLLGYVGNSGNAATTETHLHFGISRPTFPEDWQARRGQIDPFSYLVAWRNGQNLTPALTPLGAASETPAPRYEPVQPSNTSIPVRPTDTRWPVRPTDTRWPTVTRGPTRTPIAATTTRTPTPGTASSSPSAPDTATATATALTSNTPAGFRPTATRWPTVTRWPTWTRRPTDTRWPTVTSRFSATPSRTPSLTLIPTDTRVAFSEGPVVIGYSVLGRPLQVWRFGNGPVERMIIAGMHGGGEYNTIQLADQLIAYIKANPAVIPNDVTLYILRSLNPDGEARAHNINGRVNANGVDLNRNWDANWKADWKRTYCWVQTPVTAGTGPGSEPETQAVMAFIKAHHVSALINYHSAALGIFAGGLPDFPPSDRLAEAVAAVTTYPWPPINIGCEYTGGMVDWTAAQGVASLDLELTDHTHTDFTINLRVLNVLVNWEK